MTADSDGDGTSDLLDDFNGFNDSTVVVIARTNSTVMAKVADGVYAAFNSSGDKISPYLAISGASSSTGNIEIGFNASAAGGGFTFKGDDQIVFQYTAIANPVGLP